MEDPPATVSRHANPSLLAFSLWAVGSSALILGWDLSTVDRLGRDLPDPLLGGLYERFLILAVALGIGAFATMRDGDEPRPYVLVGTVAPIAWFMWRAQDARVSGDNFALVGFILMLPLVFGATWVGVQQATLASPKRKTNGLGVAALMLAMIAIGTFTSVLALVFGAVALRQIDRSNGTQDGRDAAYGAMLVGLLGTFIFGLSLLP